MSLSTNKLASKLARDSNLKTEDEKMAAIVAVIVNNEVDSLSELDNELAKMGYLNEGTITDKLRSIAGAIPTVDPDLRSNI